MLVMDPEMPRGGPDAGPAQNEAERTAKHLRGVLDAWQTKDLRKAVLEVWQ